MPAWTRPTGSNRHSPRRARTTRSIVDDCPVHYVRWGVRDRPGIVLVHGGAAHAHWWDHVAPLLANECCVVALDLSGHGDSGRRDALPDVDRGPPRSSRSREHAGIAGPPIVVGHSMGGWVAITAAAEHGDRLDGIVVLDSPVRRRAPEEEAAAEGVAFGPLRTYPTLEHALARFRTVPDQPTSLPYVLDHVARTSVAGGRRAAGPGSSTRGSSTARSRPASSSGGCDAGWRCSAPSTAW